jgi:hypothetical protein
MVQNPEQGIVERVGYLHKLIEHPVLRIRKALKTSTQLIFYQQGVCIAIPDLPEFNYKGKLATPFRSCILFQVQVNGIINQYFTANNANAICPGHIDQMSEEIKSLVFEPANQSVFQQLGINTLPGLLIPDCTNWLLAINNASIDDHGSNTYGLCVLNVGTGFGKMRFKLHSRKSLVELKLNKKPFNLTLYS